jgi:hypothetical protein
VESLDGDGAHSALALAETAREHFSEAAAAQKKEREMGGMEKNFTFELFG